MNAEKTPLPESLILKDILEGKVQVPPKYHYSLNVSYLGQINSISQDTVYAATSSLKKKKNLTLGLALNSLTGSRKVVEMMSRLGQCVSNHTIKEIENEMTI